VDNVSDSDISADDDSESDDSTWCCLGDPLAPYPHSIELFFDDKLHTLAIGDERLRIKHFMGRVAPLLGLPSDVVVTLDSVLLCGDDLFASLSLGAGGRLLRSVSWDGAHQVAALLSRDPVGPGCEGFVDD